MEEKRKEFKKLVIMGNHPGMSYKKALEAELGFGCLLHWTALMPVNTGYYTITDMDEYSNGRGIYMAIRKDREIKEPNRSMEDVYKFDQRIKTEKCYKIIGLPITLGRVMQAVLKGKYIDTYFTPRLIQKYQAFAYWQLTKDGVECTDDDQTDETIEALLELLPELNTSGSG